jgi:alpha/beta superfamily hydrolase
MALALIRLTVKVLQIAFTRSNWARALEPAPDLQVMPGVGHFFHGRLNELREAVVGWARPT